MKRINWRILIITSLLCLLPICFGFIYYNSVPQEIAIHFDIHNQPNSYLDKNIVLFLFPIGMMIMQVICCSINDLTKQDKNYKPRIEYVCKSILPIISIVIYFITLVIALGIELDVRLFVCLILAIIFILIGNYLPKTSSNYNNINKHAVRTVGHSFVIFGLLLLISLFLSAIYSVIVVGIIIIVMISETIYFYKISH